MANISKSTNAKEFERNVCFTFFEDYRKTAYEIEKDFGKEAVVDYYNAIIDYALYEKEPVLEGVIKYTWHTTKTTIDASIKRRSGGFGQEDTEMTEKVINYIRENPKATEREVADAVGCSKGKVNSVKKKYLNNYITNADTNTNTTSNTSSGHGRGQNPLETTLDKEKNASAREKSKKDRLPEALTDEEKEEIVQHYDNRDMTYVEIYKHYNLKHGCLSKDVINGFRDALRIKANKKHDEEVEANNKSALASFGLSQEEGDELSKLLFELTWKELGDVAEKLVREYTDATELSAKELLIFLRNNKWTSRYVYCKCSQYNLHWQRLDIDNNRWQCHFDYLVDCVKKYDEIKQIALPYFKSAKEKERFYWEEYYEIL